MHVEELIIWAIMHSIGGKKNQIVFPNNVLNAMEFSTIV